MKNFLIKHQNLLFNVFFVSFIFVLLGHIIMRLDAGYNTFHWGFSEYLINYQGGFVRRGLLGEILLSIYNYCGIEPYPIIIIISFITFLCLLWFFVKSFIQKKFPLFVLPFVFFLGNQIINNFVIRKDSILVLLFLLIIYFALKKSNFFLVFSNLFFILLLLIHEAMIFMCFPILLLIIVSKNANYSFKNIQNFFKTVAISSLKLLPAIIIFCCVTYFHGEPTTGEKIWNSWKNVPAIQEDLAKKPDLFPGAIAAIDFSLAKGFVTFSLPCLTRIDHGVPSLLILILTLIAIYFVLSNLNRLNFIKIFKFQADSSNFNKKNISNVLIFQLISISPLFIIGNDYGRWIFFWIISSFGLIFLLPTEKLESLFPQFISTVSEKLNFLLNKYLSKSNYFLLLLCFLIGVPVVNWIPYGWLRATPAGTVIEFILKTYLDIWWN